MDSLFALPELKLNPSEVYGSALAKEGVTTLLSAAFFLQNFPYGFPSDHHPLTALQEGRGTCAHKHGILGGAAAEIGFSSLRGSPMTHRNR